MLQSTGSVRRGTFGTFSRENKLLLAGFFSAKLRKHQVTWLPCEIEVLRTKSSLIWLKK